MTFYSTSMAFTLHSTTKKQRRGVLTLPHGKVQTPFFMPIATRGAVKSLAPDDVKKLGAQIILSNTYHLLQRPGLDFLKKYGGLHAFMGWNKPILTDSGGYQVFSLSKFRTITREGVTFQSEIDGRTIVLTPESAIEAQFAIGSDIMMTLDYCDSWPITHERASEVVDITLHWARRCKEHYDKLVAKKTSRTNIRTNIREPRSNTKRPLIFGIVQGSLYTDLRMYCVRELVKIGFDGYAIGGVAPKKKVMEFVELCTGLLPADAPRYLMGVGKPEDIVEAVAVGVDMFDCVIPTREARHGLLYRKKTRIRVAREVKKLFYDTVRIKHETYRNDFRPIDSKCLCMTCQTTTRAYLRHLFITQETLYMRYASIHNLAFYLDMMRELH